MKKNRLLKISAALMISCFYTFFSCFVGTTTPNALSAEAMKSLNEKNTALAVQQSAAKATVTSQTAVTSTATESTIPMLDLSNIPDALPNPEATSEEGGLLFDFTYNIKPDFSVEAPVVVEPSDHTVTTTTRSTPQATTTTPTTTTTTTATATTPISSSSSQGESSASSSKETTTTTTTTTTTVTTTTTATPPYGWTDTFTVYNNLYSASDYRQNVTADAFTIICRNVQAEMGPSFETEALKAQALACYSYLKTQSKIPSLPLATTVSDKVRDAVSAVNGQAVYYNGRYAQTVYCASTAGASANCSDVWGGSLPYLISVDCPVDKLYDPNYGVVTNFKSAEIAGLVKSATGLTLTGDPSKWFTDIVRGSGGYITSMTIGGAGRVNGDAFRAKIMGYKIKSGNFTITYSAETDSFTITTYGYGHGVGMSQNGANAYAKYYHYNYIQILEHYFFGVTIA